MGVAICMGIFIGIGAGVGVAGGAEVGAVAGTTVDAGVGTAAAVEPAVVGATVGAGVGTAVAQEALMNRCHSIILRPRLNLRCPLSQNVLLHAGADSLGGLGPSVSRRDDMLADVHQEGQGNLTWNPDKFQEAGPLVKQPNSPPGALGLDLIKEGKWKGHVGKRA